MAAAGKCSAVGCDAAASSGVAASADCCIVGVEDCSAGAEVAPGRADATGAGVAGLLAVPDGGGEATAEMVLKGVDGGDASDCAGGMREAVMANPMAAITGSASHRVRGPRGRAPGVGSWCAGTGGLLRRRGCWSMIDVLSLAGRGSSADWSGPVPQCGAAQRGRKVHFSGVLRCPEGVRAVVVSSPF